ncbi:MAG TPA: c-type cytochrome [Polyangia bacterium]|nr:c-type cytochrome [Polyangia bacterium]
MSKIPALVLVVAGGLLVAGGARAAETKTAEQVFKNIQVLKGMPAAQLDPAMDVMAGALGVQCNYCHVVGGKGKPPAMEKDDKQAKRTARKMVTMMQKINHDFFGDEQVVTCATCHNGRPEPRTVPPVERVAKEPEPGKVPAGVTVKSLVDKWTQASGGAAAWKKLKTRVTTGTIEGFGPAPFGMEIVQASPEKVREQLTMPSGTFTQGWDGKSGYRAFNGNPRPLDDVDEIRREAQFAPPLTLSALLSGAKVVADMPLDKGMAHVIEGRQGEAHVKLWFDPATGLLARMTVNVPTPVGDLPSQTDFEDYKTVDGVKLPFTIKTNQGGQTSIARYTDIKHNAKLEDAEFEAPKAPPPPAPQGK